MRWAHALNDANVHTVFVAWRHATARTREQNAVALFHDQTRV